MITGSVVERPGRRERGARSAVRRAGVWAATALVALLGLLALVARVGAAAGPGGEAAVAQLKSLSWRTDRSVTSLVIEASAPVAYVTSQPDPLTVLVDLRNAESGTLGDSITPPGSGVISQVGIEDTRAPDGTALARVRVQMTAAAKPRVRSERNLIYVDIDARGATPRAPSPSAARAKAAITPRTAGATRLHSVRISTTPLGPQVVLGGDGRLIVAAVEEARDLPPRLVLDFEGVAASAPAVTRGNIGAVQQVRVATRSRSPLVTRVVIDLARILPYTIDEAGADGADLVITFDTRAEAAPASNALTLDPISALTRPTVADAPPAAAPPAREPDKTPLPATPIVARIAAAEAAARKQAAPQTAASAPQPAAPAPQTAAPVPQPPPPTPQPAPAAPQPPAPPQNPPVVVPAPPQNPPVVVPAPPAAQPPTAPPAGTTMARECGDPPYTGAPVSMDFQQMDLRAVLRVFADVSGLNFIIEPSVTGSVDVQLRDVPWDQALAMILRSNKLGCAIEGNIVRIATITELAAEQKQRQELAAAQTLAGDLGVATRTLSYARAEDLAQLVTRSVLSTRGTVQVDPRTNTIIITDLPGKLPDAVNLVMSLDTPQPQVEIEARIVETTRNFVRDLGIQWGITGRVAPELGNTTGLAFPNQGTLSGRIGGANGGFQGPPAQNDAFAPTAINLPAGAPNTALGLSLGSVNGAVNLDAILTTLETSGKGRLLSTPRVSTQNNIEAEITQGVEIPIQTVANNTVTVTFKSAALTLKVTPQITAAGTVIMKISVENASPDFTRSVNNIPPINTQRANTQVLVNDGQTTVIGGVYTSNETQQRDNVPGIHRIPLLGWLFKRQRIEDGSRELLIFITPRIIKS